MKKTFFLLFLMLLPLSALAQTKDFGVITYEMRSGVRKVKVNTGKLFFNDSISKFISNKIGYDSIQKGDYSSSKMSLDNSGHLKSISVNISHGVSKTGIITYRDFKKRTVLMPLHNVFYPYGKLPKTLKDNWIPIDWYLKDSYKEILGYKVQKAVGQFRGVKYVAWFTKEIPFPYGPGILFGLPGAILEAYTTLKDRFTLTNILFFKAKKVCFPCPDKARKLTIPDTTNLIGIKKYVFLTDHRAEMIAIKLNLATKKKNPVTFFKNGKPTTLKSIKKRREEMGGIIYGWEDFPGDTPNPFGPRLKKAMEEINDTTNLPVIGSPVKGGGLKDLKTEPDFKK